MGGLKMKQELLQRIFDDSIAFHGDTSKIIQCMIKAECLEPVTIGFIGGSITQGCLSSTPKTCYAYQVFDWWCKNYPNTPVRYLNAGIGGTTSEFGVARVEEDLLRYDPDLVIVEFSVNDDNNEHFEETFEGLIRKILDREKAEPAVMIVNNVRYDDGMNAQDVHNRIGRAYQIPCISIKDSVFPQIEKGDIKAEELTSDMLHPNDIGHELIAMIINHFLSEVKNHLKNRVVHETVTKNRFQDSLRIQNSDKEYYQCDGFKCDHDECNDITDCFKKGFRAEKKGNRITFFLTGRNFSVQYKKTINRPAPIAVAIIDGNEDSTVLLDANFKEEWGDCLFLQLLAQDLSYGEHQIEIRIIETHPDDRSDFYLVSLIASGREI